MFDKIFFASAEEATGGPATSTPEGTLVCGLPGFLLLEAGAAHAFTVRFLGENKESCVFLRTLDFFKLFLGIFLNFRFFSLDTETQDGASLPVARVCVATGDAAGAGRGGGGGGGGGRPHPP